MINAGSDVAKDVLNVVEGVELKGRVNVDDGEILRNVLSAIRRGHPQLKPSPLVYDRIALVGGGPSLADTVDELRDAYFEGAKVVTLNGAYGWCVERNIRPSMQVVMDARAHNARFVDPPVPNCRYLLASQCHPATFDAVEGRDHVWIFHAAPSSGDGEIKKSLDAYYDGNWYGVPGGTTVFTRAVGLLRAIGYVRFDVFGVDSCWMGDASHAYAQAENERDRRLPFKAHPVGHPEFEREFICSPWHVQQVVDFLQMVRVNGTQFLINFHGDGLLRFVLESCAGAAVASGGDVSF